MLNPLRRDVVAGAAGGLLGGLVFVWALAAQDMLAQPVGLLGLRSTGVGFVLHLVVSALIGAGFGAIFRYQPASYAATITGGVLYGLLWWIAGPLTLTPLTAGSKPTWSLAEAATAFPSLIGHLLFGGITGLGFYVFVTLALRGRPEPDALLFRRQSYDLASALGWGVSYGFVWWVLGPLTLFPLLLGTAPDWTVGVAGALTAPLVGHIAYGAFLGITYYRLEARFSLWWIPREVAGAARVTRRRDQALTSAPALWALTSVIGLTLPPLLGR
jgi:uncharacterized membrane protein YagU involved in acid resistance